MRQMDNMVGHGPSNFQAPSCLGFERIRTLNCAWKHIGRQYRSFSTGVIQSLYPAPRNSLVAAFWMKFEVSELVFSKAAPCMMHYSILPGYNQSIDPMG